MKQIYFSNTSFNDGVNLTVRRGIKWGIPFEKYSDYDIELMDLEAGKTLGYGNVIRQIAMSFKDLVDEDLKDEQDPECRTVDGLRTIMKQVYEDFDTREIVTLLYFSVDKIR